VDNGWRWKFSLENSRLPSRSGIVGVLAAKADRGVPVGDFALSTGGGKGVGNRQRGGVVLTRPSPRPATSPGSDPDAVWRKSLALIRKRVNPQCYLTWFSAVALHGIDGQVVTMAVPNGFFVEWMASTYNGLILEAVGAVVERSLEKVEYVVSDQLPVPEKAAEAGAAAGAAVAAPPATVPAEPAPRLGAAARGLGASGYLNPKYTFETFVVGASNQFAHAAARAVAENPAKAYNPLFVYGDVGLGKTHLLHAIGARIRERQPKARICNISSEQFTNEVINSIRYDRMADFRSRYRNCDVLIIDDIQFISGKDRTQEEFFHTFKALHEAGRQIVLSSDRFPKEMPDLEKRLRSRFDGGLIADIQSPDLETRIAILEKKAEADGVRLPSDVSHLLATHVQSNVRELEGALIRLGAYASLTGREITVELARQNLRDLIKEPRKLISLEEIQQRVARTFSVRVADLKAKKRTKELVLPRQVAMTLCRRLTELSFPDIGRGFGGRDHTTVMHACKQVERLTAGDPGLAATVDGLARSLQDGE
jgi:chromosomal replication initiator protein